MNQMFVASCPSGRRLRFPGPDDALAVVHVRRALPDFLAQLHLVHDDVFAGPAEDVGHEQNKALEVARGGHLANLANGALRRVGRPVAKRTLDVTCLDVDKASGLKGLDLQVVFEDTEGVADLLAAFEKERAPLGGGRVGCERIVVAQDVGGGFVALEVAAGCKDAVGLIGNVVPVGDGADEVAGMDKVDRVVVKGPGLGKVFDLAVLLAVGGPAGVERRRRDASAYKEMLGGTQVG